MGYNTTLLLLNDGFDAIKRDPDWINRVISEVNGWKYSGPVTVPASNHSNPSMILSVDHADFHNVLAVGGNYGTVLGRFPRFNLGHSKLVDQLDLIRLLANDLGYALVHKEAVFPRR